MKQHHKYEFSTVYRHIHVSVSFRLFIRLIVDSFKRHSSSRTPSPPICLCLLCSVIYQSIHLPPVVPTLIHRPTLCCLISLSANLPSAICLTFPTLISQSVPEEKERLECIWLLLKQHSYKVCSSLSSLISNRSQPLTFYLWQIWNGPPDQKTQIKVILGWHGSHWYFDHLTYSVYCRILIGGLYL